MVVIGRPINGIGLNGHEFVLDENQEPMKFDCVETAEYFLYIHGYNKSRIELEGIDFIEEESGTIL